jgi:hypothetical protein
MDFAYMDEREALYVRKQYEQHYANNYQNGNYQNGNYQNGYDLSQYSLANTPSAPLTPTQFATPLLAPNPLLANPLQANPALVPHSLGNPLLMPSMLTPLNPLQPMMGLPATMVRPAGEQKQGNNLGFQMNPISRNKKK